MLVTRNVVTREEVIVAIQEIARREGRTPRFPELCGELGVSRDQIIGLFGGYTKAVKESGFVPRGQNGREVRMDDLFFDWVEVARKAGRVPGVWEYEKDSRYSDRPLKRRFKRWAQVAKGLLEFGEEKQLWAGWGDVREITQAYVKELAAKEEASSNVALASSCTFKPEKTMSTGEGQWMSAEVVDVSDLYGEPLTAGPLAYAPTNEPGVVYVFGSLARDLGFVVLKMQSAFPDCEALRRVGKGKWQRVRVEFEFESRNFVAHDHDTKGCDLIICWEHNWAECPLEVVELKEAFKKQFAMML